MPSKSKKQARIESKEAMAAWLAGFFDGEGTVVFLEGDGPTRRQISVCNTDKGLVDTAVRFLKALGFSVGVCCAQSDHEGWSAKWTIYVTGGRAAYERFLELIPLQHEGKLGRLKRILGSYKTREEIAEAHRNGETLRCSVCGKEFYSCRAVVKRGRQFCSIECRGKAQRKRIEKTCLICGERFETIPSKSNRKYCSIRCMAEAKRKDSRLAERLRRQASAAASARWRAD